jgi:hypothetical protein
METPFLKIPKVSSHEEGVMRASAVCTCKHKSFQGAYWTIDGKRHQYTWAELERMNKNRKK